LPVGCLKTAARCQSFFKKVLLASSPHLVNLRGNKGAAMDDQERMRWQHRVSELQQAVRLWMAFAFLAVLFFIVSLVRGIV
jgi:hypothetical protein